MLRAKATATVVLALLICASSQAQISFDAPLRIALPHGAGQALAVADFDGDGQQDAAVAQGSAQYVSISYAFRDGSPGAAQSLRIPFATDLCAIATGTWNEAGPPGLAVLDRGGSLHFIEGRADGLPHLVDSLGDLLLPLDLATADIDDDGTDEVFVLDADGSVLHLIDRIGGDWQIAESLAVAKGGSPLVAWDDDRDGRPSLWMTGSGGRRLVAVDWERGRLRQRSPRSLPLAAASFGLADLNGDRALDLYVFPHERGSVLALTASSTGARDSEVIARTPRDGCLGAVADLDEDGSPEIVIYEPISRELAFYEPREFRPLLALDVDATEITALHVASQVRRPHLWLLGGRKSPDLYWWRNLGSNPSDPDQVQPSRPARSSAPFASQNSSGAASPAASPAHRGSKGSGAVPASIEIAASASWPPSPTDLRIQVGIDDRFAAGIAEPIDLPPALRHKLSGKTHRGCDRGGRNRWFATRFAKIPADVIDAHLVMRVCSTGLGHGSDRLRLGFADRDFWFASRSLDQISQMRTQAPSATEVHNHTRTLHLSLRDAPGGAALLSLMAREGSLDLVIGDDTAVDFVALDLRLGSIMEERPRFSMIERDAKPTVQCGAGPHSSGLGILELSATSGPRKQGALLAPTTDALSAGSLHWTLPRWVPGSGWVSARLAADRPSSVQAPRLVWFSGRSLQPR